MQPTISVIIPNYNHAKFLPERIESVLNQTFQDFEVIILDDCSTDSSKEVIERYRNHPKISKIVFNEINSGSTFKQWYKGIKLAKCDYIWIAESDDIAEPDFLERLIKVISTDKNIVLAFSNIDLVDQNSELIDISHLMTFQNKAIVHGDYFIRHNMIFGCHILNASSAIFRKEAALSIPEDFMRFHGAGDYIFWIEIARQGKVYKDSNILDHFRQHKTKVTPNSVATGKQFHEVHEIFNRLEDLNYINKINRQLVIGFWLKRIDDEKYHFNSSHVYRECKELWEKETSFPNLAKILYLTNGVFRRIKKKLFRYGR